MKQRGRKSAAQLAVVQGFEQGRPSPPDNLLPSERELWDAIVATRKPDFFEEASFPLLTEYCRLKTQVDLLAEEIESFDPKWLKNDEGVARYRDLCGIRDKAQGRMIGLARSMRLTQQSRYVPDKQVKSVAGSNRKQRVWERG